VIYKQLSATQIMKLIVIGITFLLCSPAFAVPQNGVETSQILTTYDKAKDKTTVRLSPVKISGATEQYHSIHVAPAFSYPGEVFQRPAIIDFEVQTIVKTKLKIDLYVVFLVDGETIFLSSNRWAVRRPVPGKRWVGERLVFRMPYETLMKITKATTVEIKMDGVGFSFSGTVLKQLREFAGRAEGQ
jgi:hypothetical protein